MKLLIKQARIIDSNSLFHKKSADLLIENGIITQIDNSINEKVDKILDFKNTYVSPGWVDVFSHFNDPGYEYKETLESGAAAAAAGGFTDVMIIPNTSPCIHNKASVEYIVQKSRTVGVNIHPIGAVTRNAEGKELAEMYDMKVSGAVAFGDGINSIQSSELLVKALQYVKSFNGTIIQIPDDKSINPHGLMNEGIISTQLGLPGIPAMAEELIVARDIKLARYAESKIHFTGVSTRKSLEYIRRAKDSGLSVSCSATPYHMYFCDEDLKHYDSNLKVNPPLRSRDHMMALREAVLDGTIDCLASHHLPHEYDSKVLEFEYAKHGMIGLETSFAILNTILPELKPEQIVNLLSTNARKIFDLDKASINKGNKAILTLFNTDENWTYEVKNSKSRSKNTPFDGVSFKGKVLGIINENKIPH